jgi:uncharacterized protein (DUF1330 family)
MAAYLIALIDVKDPEAYRSYVARSPAVIAKYNGRFLARGGQSVTLEGEAVASRIVLLEFPTLEHAKTFYASPEYQEAKLLREGAAVGRFFAVQGVDAPAGAPVA